MNQLIVFSIDSFVEPTFLKSVNNDYNDSYQLVKTVDGINVWIYDAQ